MILALQVLFNVRYISNSLRHEYSYYRVLNISSNTHWIVPKIRQLRSLEKLAVIRYTDHYPNQEAPMYTSTLYRKISIQ